MKEARPVGTGPWIKDPKKYLKKKQVLQQRHWKVQHTNTQGCAVYCPKLEKHLTRGWLLNVSKRPLSNVSGSDDFNQVFRKYYVKISDIFLGWGRKPSRSLSLLALVLVCVFCGSQFLQGDKPELERARQHLTMNCFHLLHWHILACIKKYMRSFPSKFTLKKCCCYKTATVNMQQRLWATWNCSFNSNNL